MEYLDYILSLSREIRQQFVLNYEYEKDRKGIIRISKFDGEIISKKNIPTSILEDMKGLLK